MGDREMVEGVPKVENELAAPYFQPQVRFRNKCANSSRSTRHAKEYYFFAVKSEFASALKL